MTYFDPEIYNEDNLTDADRAEVEFWWKEFENSLYEAENDMFGEEEDRDLLDKVQAAVVQRYTERLKKCFSSRITEYVAYLIDKHLEKG